MVAEKQVATNVLLEEIGVQRADADVQNEMAGKEAEKAALASSEAAEIEERAEGELSMVSKYINVLMHVNVYMVHMYIYIYI
jgi:hypothetical protein